MSLTATWRSCFFALFLPVPVCHPSPTFTLPSLCNGHLTGLWLLSLEPPSLTKKLSTVSFQYAEPSSHYLLLPSTHPHCTPKHTPRLWGHEWGSTSLKRQPRTLTQGLRTQRSRCSGVCTEKAVGYSRSTWFPGHLWAPELGVSPVRCWPCCRLQNLFSVWRGQ